MISDRKKIRGILADNIMCPPKISFACAFYGTYVTSNKFLKENKRHN
jgi:hypothetical protein